MVEARQRHLDRLTRVLPVLDEGDTLLVDLAAGGVDPVALLLQVRRERARHMVRPTGGDPGLQRMEVGLLAVRVLVQRAEALLQVGHQPVHRLRLPDQQILHRRHLGLELLAHRRQQFPLLVEVLGDSLETLAGEDATCHRGRLRGRRASRLHGASRLRGRRLHAGLVVWTAGTEPHVRTPFALSTTHATPGSAGQPVSSPPPPSAVGERLTGLDNPRIVRSRARPRRSGMAGDVARDSPRSWAYACFQRTDSPRGGQRFE